jgi:hypothetical protein
MWFSARLPISCDYSSNYKVSNEHNIDEPMFKIDDFPQMNKVYDKSPAKLPPYDMFGSYSLENDFGEYNSKGSNVIEIDISNLKRKENKQALSTKSTIVGFIIIAVIVLILIGIFF